MDVTTPLDLPDALFERYLAGHPSAEDDAAVRAWLGENPGNHTRLMALSNICSIKSNVAERDVDRAWERFEQRFQEDKKRQARRRLTLGASSRTRSIGQKRAPIHRVLAAAVGVAATVGVITLAVRTETNHAGPRRIVATGNAERKRVELPDGSMVLLAPASRVSYDPTFAGNARAVTLDGEGLFTVVKASGKPFVVRAGDVDTRVLGTSFAVRRYAEDSAVHVLVATGKVALGAVVLGTGDAARVTPAGVSEVTHAVNVAAGLAWADGALVLQSTPLRAAIPEFARWRGLDISVTDPRLLQRPITVTLTDESVDEVVDILSSVFEASVVRHGTHLILSPRSGAGHVE